MIYFIISIALIWLLASATVIYANKTDEMYIKVIIYCAYFGLCSLLGRVLSVIAPYESVFK